MYTLNTKKIFAISFLILLSLSIATPQVYRLKVTQGINVTKDNFLNNEFQSYRIKQSTGCCCS